MVEYTSKNACPTVCQKLQESTALGSTDDAGDVRELSERAIDSQQVGTFLTLVFTQVKIVIAAGMCTWLTAHTVLEKEIKVVTDSAAAWDALREITNHKFVGFSLEGHNIGRGGQAYVAQVMCSY